METSNSILNNLFNGLSSIYRTDDGMVSSNLFTVFNSEAEVFADVQRKVNQVSNNTYISLADPDALESNFGVLVQFPKPPRLNTLAGGDEIYRAMLKAMFRIFQSGATTGSMEQALSTAISYLTIDPNTSPAKTVINYTNLYTVDTQIALTWPAVQASSGNVVGPARDDVAASGDIVFFPSDLIVTDYDPATQIISFTGTVNTGTLYSIIYNRDNTLYNGTNWVNLTNTSGTAVSPFNLKSQPVSTYDNPIFSYWWNTFNANGQGIIIDQFSISGTDSSLVWRLPEKTIQFVSPYSGKILTKTIDFYNESGTAFDITQVNASNPDILFTDTPTNYYTDVSSNFSDYYIRYSENNNGPNIALSPFLGSFPSFLKQYSKINFLSSNFGQLDFFEKNNNFDVNNLFGTGTVNVWLNVPNVNSQYSLSNDFIFKREFSLHQNILYDENFESGKLNRISTTNTTGTRISDIVGVPLLQKDDCLMLIGLSSGVSISASPILNPLVISQANHVEVDFFDGLNSGTSSSIDIIVTGNVGQYNDFRFGIDPNATNSYFYQIFTGIAANPSKVYLNQFPRNTGWNTLTVDFGTYYTGTSASLNNVGFLNTSIPFSGSILSTSGISLNTNTIYPLSEYSFFDNIEVSYYNPSQVLSQYGLSINLFNDWEGSVLSESTIIDNKFFQLDPQPNFQFDVFIKGLDPSFIFIIEQIIDKLKPCHTVATAIFEQDQDLDTTKLVPSVSNSLTDWETGNIMQNIAIKSTGQMIIPVGDLPGFITIPSGS